MSKVRLGHSLFKTLFKIKGNWRIGGGAVDRVRIGDGVARHVNGYRFHIRRQSAAINRVTIITRQVFDICTRIVECVVCSCISTIAGIGLGASGNGFAPRTQ